MIDQGATAHAGKVKSRARIKSAALALFAARGIEAVSTRELANVCGLKNAGSVNYHFGSKEELIIELIRDASAIIEVDRNRQLDLLEATGRPISVRDIITILADMSAPAKETNSAGRYAWRLLNAVYQQDRGLLLSALGDGADSGTRRCLSHLRRLITHVPPDVLRARLLLALDYLFSVAATREAAVERPNRWLDVWGKPFAHSNLLDTVEGLLCCNPSQETLARLG